MKANLERLIARQDLRPDQATSLAEALCEGRLPEAMVGAILAALSAKGETVEELDAFARVLRAWARRPALGPRNGPLVDIVGTGGDGSGSLNISTAAAIVAAGAGLHVAKHGNRAVSGRCGAADVLAALGVDLGMDVGECLNRAGFAFLFAPSYHPALAALAPVRRALGVRTIFNLLGPLVNPASPTHAVLGACSIDLARKLARVARQLGMERCLVVCSNNGWDEATTVSPFVVIESNGTSGELIDSVRSAADYGLACAEEPALRGGDASANAQAIRELLRGQPSALRDAAVITAGLALEATGMADSALTGIRLAAAAIDDGRARRVLETVVARGGVSGAVA